MPNAGLSFGTRLGIILLKGHGPVVSKGPALLDVLLKRNRVILHLLQELLCKTQGAQLLGKGLRSILFESFSLAAFIFVRSG